MFSPQRGARLLPDPAVLGAGLEWTVFSASCALKGHEDRTKSDDSVHGTGWHGRGAAVPLPQEFTALRATDSFKESVVRAGSVVRRSTSLRSFRGGCSLWLSRSLGRPPPTRRGESVARDRGNRGHPPDFSERESVLVARGRTDFAKPESVARERGSGATGLGDHLHRRLTELLAVCLPRHRGPPRRGVSSPRPRVHRSWARSKRACVLPNNRENGNHMPEANGQHLSYTKRRYLEHHPLQQLEDRLRRLRFNHAAAHLSSFGYGILPQTWLAKIDDVVEEYRLRGAPPPPDESLLPESDQAKGAALPLLPPRAVVKYGPGEHLRAAHEAGDILLRPASYYDDESLGPHRADNELVRRRDINAFGAYAVPVREADGSPIHNGPRIPIPGNFEITDKTDDYWVWCGSCAMERRLITDFKADACLIIRDVSAFAKRLSASVVEAAERLLRGQFAQLDTDSRAVTYFDPCGPSLDLRMRIPVFWWKSIYYAYQHEWRVTCVPVPRPVRHLPELKLRLGSLRDIADFHYFSKQP